MTDGNLSSSTKRNLDCQQNNTFERVHRCVLLTRFFTRSMWGNDHQLSMPPKAFTENRGPPFKAPRPAFPPQRPASPPSPPCLPPPRPSPPPHCPPHALLTVKYKEASCQAFTRPQFSRNLSALPSNNTPPPPPSPIETSRRDLGVGVTRAVLHVVVRVRHPLRVVHRRVVSAAGSRFRV